MNKTIIIAEAGVNHNGDISMAKKLIDVAAYAKADYVKFQTFKAEKLVSKFAMKANYQKNRFKDSDNGQFNMLKNLELNHNDHLELIEYSKKKRIKFLSTAFDIDGIKYLNSLKLDLFKIPSGEITNYPYLNKISLLNKPVILSTGMSNMDEIGDAIKVLTSNNLSINDIIILHCNTEYPTPMSDVNLNLMLSIKNKFNTKVGYSDHTLGIEVPIAAVSLGASVIEKHFTLDRNLKGPDHFSSLEPHDLKLMVESIRNIEKAISGSLSKEPTKSEFKNIKNVRKSIHFKKDMKKGELIYEKDLITLRPATGINPMQWKNVINKKLKNDIKFGTSLKWNDIV